MSIVRKCGSPDIPIQSVYTFLNYHKKWVDDNIIGPDENKNKKK